MGWLFSLKQTQDHQNEAAEQQDDHAHIQNDDLEASGFGEFQGRFAPQKLLTVDAEDHKSCNGAAYHQQHIQQQIRQSGQHLYE